MPPGHRTPLRSCPPPQTLWRCIGGGAQTQSPLVQSQNCQQKAQPWHWHCGEKSQRISLTLKYLKTAQPSPSWRSRTPGPSCPRTLFTGTAGWGPAGSWGLSLREQRRWLLRWLPWGGPRSSNSSSPSSSDQVSQETPIPSSLLLHCTPLASSHSLPPSPSLPPA